MDLVGHTSSTLQERLFYLTLVSAFTGTLWLSVEVGPIHIFPYRVLLVNSWLLFGFGILLLNRGRMSLSHVKVKEYLSFLWIWLAYALISMVWAADAVAALKNIIFLFSGVSMVFFIVYWFRDISRLSRLFWLWLLVFLALIPVGFWEIVTGNHLPNSMLFGEQRHWLLFVPTTIFGNENDYATFLALTLPMVLVWVRYCTRMCGRILGSLGFVAGLFLLVLTASRANYIALLVGLVFWFLFLLKLKGRIRILVGIAVVLAVVTAVVPGRVQESLKIVVTQMSSLSGIVSRADGIGSNALRANLVRNALHFTARSAGFGVGAGNAEYYMGHYAIYPVGRTTNLHNWWMEILVNYGVLILAGYVILYVALVLNLWRAYRRVLERTARMICEALLVGLVSFSIASISSSSIIAFSPQWVYLGFCVALLNYTRVRCHTGLRDSTLAELQRI